MSTRSKYRTEKEWKEAHGYYKVFDLLADRGLLYKEGPNFPYYKDYLAARKREKQAQRQASKYEKRMSKAKGRDKSGLVMNEKVFDLLEDSGILEEEGPKWEGYADYLAHKRRDEAAGKSRRPFIYPNPRQADVPVKLSKDLEDLMVNTAVPETDWDSDTESD